MVGGSSMEITGTKAWKIGLVLSWLFGFWIIGWNSVHGKVAGDDNTATGDDSGDALVHQIGELLSAKCVSCHRPDNAKGNLDLTTRDGLFRGGDSGASVVPGEPENSPIYTRSLAINDVPPEMPETGEPLSAEESSALRSWIEQGATWPDELVLSERSKADASWWAFQPLKSHNDGAGSQSLDDFIIERLEQDQLSLSTEADRRTLIRRLTFDLHGLPPTIEAVEAFVQDRDPRAYEKLVDRLLDSPHYGERFAQHWLDIAHYADTHGFERDQRRDHAWRYRDYVIRAFNEDKPYDRFLREQIAGDVLWPEDAQAVIATGFLAAGPWDFVGQVETKSEQLRRATRTLDIDDMVTQVMTATVAMTVNCARCHDHKLDPISQQEYYQLQAVFAGVRRADRLVSDSAQASYEQTKQRLTTRTGELEEAIGRLVGSGFNLADAVGGGSGFGTGKPRGGIDPRSGQAQTKDLGGLENVNSNKFVDSDLTFVDGVFVANGENGRARIPVSSTGVVIEGLPTTSGNAWDLIRNGPVNSQHSTELSGVQFSDQNHSLLGLHANAGITFDLAAIRLALSESTESRSTSTEQPKLELANNDREMRFTAQLGYFGAIGNYFADAWVFVDGNRVAHYSKLGREDGLQTIDVPLPAAARFLTLVATDGGNGYSMDQIGFGNPRITFALPAELSEEDLARLGELRGELQELQSQLSSLALPERFYGVKAESSLPEVRVLRRGDPESPVGDALEPGSLAVLSTLSPDLGSASTQEGQRRVALADWITDPANALTPRVIANRIWHWHFGQGLVNTPSDFGFGGDRPSHPMLLDWLAAQLIQNNWSLKEMHRLILNSRTYKQSSLANANVGAVRAEQLDADNRLLWRQNPRRIEAESIRDAVLFVTGKLNLQRGGPGFEDFTYEEAYAPIYKYITADKPELWKRSIYRYKVRTTPNRFLTTLDCPDPANLSPNRWTTTTPLQSLALYNNDFMLRQAQYLSERIATEVGMDLRMQVQRAFELTFARQPQEREVALAEELVRRQSLFALCRALLNSNEFVYVD